jgi:hypothetical protein
MSNITIGRYDHESITKDYAGYIEPSDKSWIIWLDADGKPCLYYPERDTDGGVTGEGINLVEGVLEAIVGQA